MVAQVGLLVAVAEAWRLWVLVLAAAERRLLLVLVVVVSAIFFLLLLRAGAPVHLEAACVLCLLCIRCDLREIRREAQPGLVVLGGVHAATGSASQSALFDGVELLCTVLIGQLALERVPHKVATSLGGLMPFVLLDLHLLAFPFMPFGRGALASVLRAPRLRREHLERRRGADLEVLRS